MPEVFNILQLVFRPSEKMLESTPAPLRPARKYAKIQSAVQVYICQKYEFEHMFKILIHNMMC